LYKRVQAVLKIKGGHTKYCLFKLVKIVQALVLP